MKKSSVILIACILSFFLLSPSYTSAASFPDVKTYAEEIGYLTDKGIIRGYPDGTFGPQKELTRLHGVQILLKAKGITELDAPNPKFTDMPIGSHGYEEVAKAVELGIISGKTNANGAKYFDPSGKLTRGQMAKIIVESMNYQVNHSYAFTDVPRSSGYYNYVSTLTAERITEGYEDRTFKPNAAVTRQHFAVFVARMLNDQFKPKLKPVSFLMDNTMDYTWAYKEDEETYLSTSRYIGKYTGSSAVWDLWRETGNGESGEFVVYESEEGLYQGYPDSHSYIDLAYPLFEGKKFGDPTNMIDSSTYTVISMDREIKIGAGTFYNVVELKDSDGWTYYYAPNVGLIKSVENGKDFAELVKLTPRR